MGLRNGSGYSDKTAGKAIYLASQHKYVEEFVPTYDSKKVYEYPIMPVPPIGFENRTPLTYEVFLHYAGYHNPSYGKWVRLKAYAKTDAVSIAQFIPVSDKKTEVTYVRRV